MLRNDANWIVAGLVAAALLPALAWFGLPFPVALVSAGIAFAGLVVLLAPRRLFEGLDVQAIGKEKLAFARDLLLEAGPAADRLAAAAERIGDVGVRERVRHLATLARDVFLKVEAQPERANAVRRFLSYYLPRAAEVAEGYALLEAQRARDPQRLAGVAAVIAKLEGAFVHYADSLAEQALGSLDVDLKLIQASLEEDLGG